MDDAITTGSTLAIAVKKLKQEIPGIKIKVAVVGLFIRRDVVRDKSRLGEPSDYLDLWVVP